MTVESTANSFIPLVLNVRNRRILVIGGGKAALIKIQNLVSSKARVIVVAPLVVDDIGKLADDGAIRWWQCKFSKKHLAGVRLVVAATDDESVNRTVIRACRIKGIMVVGSGRKSKSGLNFCGSVSRGPLSIGISTSGLAPALTKYLKKKIGKTFPPQWALVTNVMASLRKKIDKKDLTLSQKREIWGKVLNGSSIDYLLAGNLKEFRAEVKRCFSSLLE